MVELYTTLENQVRSDGSKGLLYDHYDNLKAAIAKFYTVCAAAAVSEIPYHAAFILDANGDILKKEVFDRRTTEEQTNE